MDEPMQPIDFIYRYDPANPESRPLPRDADEARRALADGNRLYGQWVDCCRGQGPPAGPAKFIVQYNPQDLGLPCAQGVAAKQAPFAVLLGCSDARVPAEIIFGQTRNNLFVVRMAGNILTEEGMGSIDYAVEHLGDSLRIVVVLGHTGCGAVSAAVDTYLSPWDHLAKTGTHAMRSIINRIFVPVRKSATALESIWGPDATKAPGYRDALLDTAIFVNAIQNAYNLRQELAQAGLAQIQVVYGVFDLVTHRVWALPHRDNVALPDVCLATAPATVAEFEELAIRMALRTAHQEAHRR
jgi:carbonic anhydrase